MTLLGFQKQNFEKFFPSNAIILTLMHFMIIIIENSWHINIYVPSELYFICQIIYHFFLQKPFLVIFTQYEVYKDEVF